MCWKSLTSLTILLLLQAHSHSAFVPTGLYRPTSSSSSSTFRHPRLPTLLRDTFDEENEYSSSFGSNGDELDFDDDDDDIIDLSNQDWRSFRAKLVLGQSAPNGGGVFVASTPSGESSSFNPVRSSNSNGPTVDVQVDDNCIPESGDCDLDGIGHLFGVPTAAVSSSSNAKKRSSTGSGIHQASSPPSQQFQQQQQYQSQQQQHPPQETRWAYDSGKLIETGAVLLGGVEQEFGFGLRQQYFHKAAILVLDHNPSTFTKGIILNRPTDMYLDDDINGPNTKWRVWFGGDVQGLDSPNPDIVCLHSLKDPNAKAASISVMKDIQWTTFENAKRLVKAKLATPQDFWVFCGYAGWGSGQLMGELERNSWYMVATDSQTLLQQLARGGASAEPREAGLDTWALLMDMMGRGSTVKKAGNNFDDLMLKEWAHKNLLSAEAGGGAGYKRDSTPRSTQAASRGGKDVIGAGSLVRASSQERSPFLLRDQELHKSVILILSDDDETTVGAILNRPAAKGLDIRIAHKDGSDARKVTLPLRFGGQYTVKNKEPLVWLHCNSVLRAANIGEPIGSSNSKRGKSSGIYKCSAVDVTHAIGQGLASPEDFFVVTGVTVWAKEEGGVAGGMQEEIRKGNFEVIHDSKTEDVWDSLSKQQVLSNDNLLNNLEDAHEAWRHGGSGTASAPDISPPVDHRGWPTKVAGSIVSNTLGRIKNGAAAEQQQQNSSTGSCVFKSNVKVSCLSDDALRNWVSIFLLGNTSP